MPRTAGTLFGLALAAGSVAFNAVEYPIALPEGAPCAAAVTPAGRAAAVPATGRSAAVPAAGCGTAIPPAQAGGTPAPQARETPAPQAVPGALPDRPSASPPAVKTTSPAAAGHGRPLPADDGANVATAKEKPMVPIVRPNESAVPAEPPATLRRLPPVESASPPAPSPSDDTIPIYPSTGK